MAIIVVKCFGAAPHIPPPMNFIIVLHTQQLVHYFTRLSLPKWVSYELLLKQAHSYCDNIQIVIKHISLLVTIYSSRKEKRPVFLSEYTTC